MVNMDIIGHVYGILTVEKELPRNVTWRNGRKITKRVFLCQCKCGNKCEVVMGNLRNGHTRSCGCYHKYRLLKFSYRHGEARVNHVTPEYKAWAHMKGRCYAKKDKRYSDYGGRGIRVCERWKDSFKNFKEDMGIRPGSNYSLDRVDNDGDYTPENCRWATREEQAQNKRNNAYITIGNIRDIIANWARFLGVEARLLYCRRGRGWSDEEIIRGRL